MISRCLLLTIFFLVLFSPLSSADSDLLTHARDADAAGEFETALRWYDEYLGTSPADQPGIIGRFETLASLSRWEEVVNGITGSGIDPAGNATLRNLLAEGYVKTGKEEEGLSLLGSSAPASDEELRIRAEALVALDRGEEALSLLKAGNVTDSGDPRLSLIMGTLLSDRKNISEAIPYLEAAYEGLPGDSTAAAGLGYAVAARGLYEEALIFAGDAARLDPDNPETWVMVAYLSARLEQYDKALDALERAIALDPSDPDLLNARAYTLYLSGRPAEARSIIVESLKKDPGNPAFLDTLGAILLTEGDPKEALGYLKRAAASLPQDPEVLTHLGDAYRLSGQDSSAQDAYQKALQTDPTQGRTWKGYSAVLLSLKRYPEAVQAISEAYRFYPGDADLIGWEQEADRILLDWYLKEESGKTVG